MSTATGTIAVEVEEYVAEVARHLGGLGADDRSELLEDLAQHLLEVAAEPGPPLRERLGPPEEYAAELLASAGVASSPQGGRGAAVAAERLSAMAGRVAASRAGHEWRRVAPSLRRVWWVARGYLVVALIAGWPASASAGDLVPKPLGNPLVGLAAIAVAVAASVRLGERSLSGWRRRGVQAANVGLALFALVLLEQAGRPQVRYVDGSGQYLRRAANQGCLTDSTGRSVTNLYAYDLDGRLLDPVLLYDDLGRPVDNLCPEYDAQGRPLATEYRRDVNGAAVINAFPRRQSVGVGGGAPMTVLPDQPSTGPTMPVPPPAAVVPKLPTTTAVSQTTVPPTTVAPTTLAPPG